MHESLTAIQEELEQVIEKLESSVPSDVPFGIAHNNWSFPGLSKNELIEEAQSIIEFIDDHETDDLGDSESLITDYNRRLKHLHSQTIPNMWGNLGQAVPAYLATLGGLRKALSSVLTEDKSEEIQKMLRKQARQVRGMEAKLNDLEPRTTSLNEMVGRIEQAYQAADQLPEDLESLTEARRNILEIVSGTTQDQGRISDIRESAVELDKQLNYCVKEAGDIIDRCESAYSAATSVGLAAAFSERSKELSMSMWFWICSLIFALAAGSYFGSSQLRILSDLFNVQAENTSVIALNLVMTFLSVGAPVWFAWLATKQIGQRFRLSEDYAFKASVSRAYEGFRREAARFDKDMEARLLTSALTRLDELPLRLVEIQSHGSPWHELASSAVVKQAMRDVPEFPTEILRLARKMIGPIIKPKAKSKHTESLGPAEKE